MPDNIWTFDQPPNCAVISLRSIVFDCRPILRVSHDEDDHGWQFLDNEIVEESNACVVLLEEIIARDPSLREIADLPPGWIAWRDAVGSPWQRTPRETAE
jgi:hypothetical protein